MVALRNASTERPCSRKVCTAVRMRSKKRKPATLAQPNKRRAHNTAVTTLGSGVDGSVRRIDYAYDGQGNAYLITSYDAASGGSIVNQVQREFNGLGQMTTEWQQHGGAVNTSTSPKVQYAYSEMSGGANHSRLTSITYPSGYVLTFNYSSGLNDSISRLSSLSDSSGTLESYDYLGLGTVVRRAHPQPGVDLTYIKQSGESNGDAGDQYTGLDRFGRVVDQRWIDTSSGTATDRFQYGYDRDSNRLWRDNLVNSAFGELYTYDGLNQLASFDRGTLNGTKTGLTGSASRSQDWNYDALGNWDSVTTDGSTQTRDHNAQNEITSVSGATTPTFDANGNMTDRRDGPAVRLRRVEPAGDREGLRRQHAGDLQLRRPQPPGDADRERHDDRPVLLRPVAGAGGEGRQQHDQALRLESGVRGCDGPARPRHGRRTARWTSGCGCSRTRTST